MATQLFSNADAHGTFRPVTVAAPCATVEQLVAERPELEYLSMLTPILTDSQACATEQMNKSAPSLPKILTMAVFTLSCFGLLLFLWLSFGGAVPLKPQGYRVERGVPGGDHAGHRGRRADRRRVGRQGPRSSSSTAIATARWRTLELDREFAPLRADRARSCARRRCWARPTSS